MKMFQTFSLLFLISLIQISHGNDSLGFRKITFPPFHPTTTNFTDDSFGPVPPKTHACYNCSSEINPGCVATEKEWNLEFCSNDICAVWIESQWTYRGCFKHWAFPHTEICRTPFCNDFILPAKRVQCHQCKGPKCVSIHPNNSVPMACRKYVEHDQCYSVIFDEKTVHRGCLSDNSEGSLLCKTNPDKCLIGPSNNQEFISCVECQSGGEYVDDPKCFRKTETTVCPYSVVENFNRCVIIENGESLIRGCLTKHRQECFSQALSSCSTCSENGCNKQEYFSLPCKKCRSDKDPSCAESHEERDIVHCISKTKEHLACYREETVVKGSSVVNRGCFNTMKNETRRSLCESNNSTTCKLCSSPLCNLKSFQTCFFCNSTYNPECATLIPAQLPLPQKNCTGYMDTCYAFVRGGVTFRDCIQESDISSCRGPDCIHCSDNLCNFTPVPEKRLKCHHCHGPNCSAEQKDDAPTLHFCEYYHKDDKCYMHLDKAGNLKRGCITDPPSICNNENCAYCTVNGCNSKPKNSKPKISCIRCSDLTCAWGFRLDDAQKCKADVPFDKSESCYTKKYRNGITERGCTLDYDKSACAVDDYDFCNTCEGNSCNRQNVARRECIVCASVNLAICALDKPKIDPVQCERKLIGYNESGCFTLNVEGIVLRGCLTDLPDSIKTHCLDTEGNACEICYENGCNRYAPAISAAEKGIFKMELMITLLLVGVLIFC